MHQTLWNVLYLAEIAPLDRGAYLPAINNEEAGLDRKQRRSRTRSGPPADEETMTPSIELRSVRSRLARSARWAGIFASAALAACVGGAALAQAPGKIPDLASSSSFAWTPLTVNGGIARYGTGWFDPPAGMRGPVKQDPGHPLRGNETRRPTPALGNWRDPILKPWAAEQMRASNEELLSGKVGIPFLAQSQCWPGGVPGQLLWTSEPMYFIQTPKQVWMIWQRDQWLRRVFMTDQRSEYVKPSWYGESIGRYENGELIVDTIGLAASKYGFIDMFRTPHTEKLHVVERFKVTADNKFLEALVKIEDEDTFNEPMYMTKRWRREPNVWVESICAENNIDPFNSNLAPPPQASQPDF
jgi:hypothetical protein